MIKALINHRRALHLPIIGMGIVLSVVCLLIGAAHHYRSNQTILLDKARSDYNATRKQLQLSKQAQHDIKQYLPTYQYLLQTGFIGQERRHEWVERLQQVSTHYQLFSVSYKVSPQATYHPSFISNLEAYEIYRSIMTLEWGLLHEKDFIDLLSGLREKAPPFMVRDCEIALASDAEINNQAMQKNLVARCIIDWITLQNPALKGGI